MKGDSGAMKEHWIRSERFLLLVALLALPSLYVGVVHACMCGLFAHGGSWMAKGIFLAGYLLLGVQAILALRTNPHHRALAVMGMLSMVLMLVEPFTSLLMQLSIVVVLGIRMGVRKFKRIEVTPVQPVPYNRNDVLTLIIVSLILFALLTWAVNKGPHMRERANITNCASNLKQLSLAIEEYKNKYQCSPSAFSDMVCGVRHHASNSKGESYVECLFMGKDAVLRDSAILNCPSYAGKANLFIKGAEPKNFDIGKCSYLFPAVDWTPEQIAASGFQGGHVPLVIERAGNHENGSNILFTDGQVEFLKFDEFPAQMHYQNAEDPESPVVDRNGKVILAP
ncbi:MAG: hypothetical protein AB7F75_09155 [Planctomycetota bacterium]